MNDLMCVIDKIFFNK